VRLIAEVTSGMLCPSLASRHDYVSWMQASGFAHVEAEDLTQRVEPTWVYGTALVRHPAVRALLWVSDTRLQRFVATFDAMRRAYAEEGERAMTEKRRNVLVRLRPRADTLYVSQSRTLLATGRDGFITGGPDHSLFVHQTRLLSRYVGAGFHEDVDLANFAQQPTAFLELEVDADFADQDTSSSKHRVAAGEWRNAR
jgi:hypothetical protein